MKFGNFELIFVGGKQMIDSKVISKSRSSLRADIIVYILSTVAFTSLIASIIFFAHFGNKERKLNGAWEMFQQDISQASITTSQPGGIRDIGITRPDGAEARVVLGHYTGKSGGDLWKEGCTYRELTDSKIPVVAYVCEGKIRYRRIEVKP